VTSGLHNHDLENRVFCNPRPRPRPRLPNPVDEREEASYVGLMIFDESDHAPGSS
jgi:hypothetical protein